ncbi:hypothetical protein HY522_07410 [bacterium]|nr:hypothetical protein [bacterium]
MPEGEKGVLPFGDLRWYVFAMAPTDKESQRRKIDWRDAAAVVLLIVGLLQMAGYIAGSKILRGVGAATAASPLPKVFSDVEGLETFASDFEMRVETSSGQQLEISITPELYQHMGGPYNRRNVYGAALSYAPRIPQRLFESVFCSGFGATGPLRKEFGLPEDTQRVSIVIRTKTRGRSDTWLLRPECFP